MRPRLSPAGFDVVTSLHATDDRNPLGQGRLRRGGNLTMRERPEEFGPDLPFIAYRTEPQRAKNFSSQTSGCLTCSRHLVTKSSGGCTERAKHASDLFIRNDLLRGGRRAPREPAASFKVRWFGLALGDVFVEPVDCILAIQAVLPAELAERLPQPCQLV